MINETEVRVVPNAAQYHEFIRQLRNDPRVAHGFLVEGSITREQQAQYMLKYGDRYVVALLGECPVGYAGVVENDLRVCVHPEFQGRGIGEILVRSVLAAFPSACVRVKWGNSASMALFSKIGYRPAVVLMTKSVE